MFLNSLRSVSVKKGASANQASIGDTRRHNPPILYTGESGLCRHIESFLENDSYDSHAS